MDFNDLPADLQLLHLNIEEKLRKLLQHEGPIEGTGKVPDRLIQRMVEALSTARAQTVEDVGGIQIAEVGARGLVVTVPSVAGWFPPEE